MGTGISAVVLNIYVHRKYTVLLSVQSAPARRLMTHRYQGEFSTMLTIINIYNYWL